MLKKRIFTIFIAVFLSLTMLVPVGLAKPDNEDGEKDKNESIYSIFFTHDIHSHMDATDSTGGLAGIVAEKQKVEEDTGYEDSFLLDGGDFSMGTPFQVLFKKEAAEMQLLDIAGYDVTTLGNHEFDYGVQGLAQMIDTAAEELRDKREKERKKSERLGRRKDQLPDGSNRSLALVTANIDWKSSLAFKESRKDAEALKEALKTYGADDYVIVDRGDKKIAVFGIMGKGAIKTMPEVNLRWTDPIERAGKIVKEIERNKEADLVVCLSHSGGQEDIDLAKKVDGIDLIVSAHTHERYDEPKKVNNTYIVAAGAFAEYLGHIVLEKDGDHFKLKDYKMHRNLNIEEGDQDIQAAVDKFKGDINNKYFSKYGMKYGKKLAENPYHFTPAIKIGLEQKEEPYANLIGDAYKEVAGVGADVVIVPKGTIRTTIPHGKVTAADAFSFNSIGTGPDGKPGYPLVAIALTGKELKAVAEVDASVSPGMIDARLYLAGLKYKINPHRVFMNRAYDFQVRNSQGQYEKIDNKKLYKVVGSLYSAQMMGAVEEKTYGLLSIKPKTFQGKPVKDFTKQIIYRKDNGEELKEWYALARYLRDQGQVPSRYAKPEGRKIVQASWNPINLLKQPNHVGIMLIAALLIPVVIIVAIILYIRKRRVERRGYAQRMFGGSLGKRNRRPSQSRRAGREMRKSSRKKRTPLIIKKNDRRKF